MLNLSGTITACITPFKNGEIDYDSFRNLLELQLDSKVDGILILGTTGESPTISQEERKKIIKYAASILKGRTTLWVGTGTNCTKKTIARTNEAASLGADIALVVTPYYNRPPQEGLKEHFKAVHSSTSIPLCLYDVPKRTGQDLEIATIQELATLPRIIALKDASGTLEKIEVLRELKNLIIFAGDDANTLAMIERGARGVISVASNLIPETMVSFVSNALNGKTKESYAYHEELTSLFKALSTTTNPIPIKAAMEYWEIASSECRLPLSSLPLETKTKLIQILENYHSICPNRSFHGTTQSSYSQTASQLPVH